MSIQTFALVSSRQKTRSRPSSETSKNIAETIFDPKVTMGSADTSPPSFGETLRRVNESPPQVPLASIAPVDESHLTRFAFAPDVSCRAGVLPSAGTTHTSVKLSFMPMKTMSDPSDDQ